MITKEQIIRDKVNASLPDIATIRMGIRNAMDEYAKEVSISFAKWLDNRRLEKAVERQKRIMKEGRQLKWKTELPNEALYELYLKTLK